MSLGRVEREGAKVRPEERGDVRGGQAEGGRAVPTPAPAEAARAGGRAEADAGAVVGGGEERARGEAGSRNVPGVRDAAEDIGEDRRGEGVEGIDDEAEAMSVEGD